MIHADGTETRIRWKKSHWRKAAEYFLDRFPQLCKNPQLSGLTIKDVMEMQQAVIEPSVHRTKQGISLERLRPQVWRQLEIIRAEAEAAKQGTKPEEAVLPPVVAKPLPPAPATPVFKELKAQDAVEEEEGESQLQFFKPVAETEHPPAYTIDQVLNRDPVPAPVPESVRKSLDWMNREVTPKMAVEELGKMSMGKLLDLIADKVADRVVARMEGTVTDQITAVMGQLSLGKPMPAQVEQAKPAVVLEVKAETKPAVKPEDKGSMKDQLLQLAKSSPKLRKPKIVIIGLIPSQARELDKEFQMFDIVHINHGNDKIKDKVENANKVIAVEAKLGSAGKMLRNMHGSNFVLCNHSLTSMRRQLDIWNTCYNEDPAFFKMNDTQKVKAGEEYARV
jgi:hypothetical protein